MTTKVNKPAKDFLYDHCGQCGYFNLIGKLWCCTMNPPVFVWIDEDQDPPSVVYARGAFEILSSAPACREFKPKRVN